MASKVYRNVFPWIIPLSIRLSHYVGHDDGELRILFVGPAPRRLRWFLEIGPALWTHKRAALLFFHHA
tara:strand:- start:15171 stop:15374 length:204 start_codon:yes stop_codon:yes gene_type:complete